MSYLRTGSETSMGCAGNSACDSCKAAPTGDLFEFKMSSIVPWALLFGVVWIVMKTPESRPHLYATTRSELGRAHGAARGALAKYRSRKKLGRYRKR